MLVSFFPERGGAGVRGIGYDALLRIHPGGIDPARVKCGTYEFAGKKLA